MLGQPDQQDGEAATNSSSSGVVGSGEALVPSLGAAVEARRLKRVLQHKGINRALLAQQLPGWAQDDDAPAGPQPGSPTSSTARAGKPGRPGVIIPLPNEPLQGIVCCSLGSKCC
jgi:hypothetical protein